MKYYPIEIKVTSEQVDDIVSSALDSGISYWASKATVNHGDYKGAEYASEVLTRGGELWITDDESGKRVKLTLDKFLKGLSLYGNHDFDNFDAADADAVVQLALYGEVVYG